MRPEKKYYAKEIEDKVKEANSFFIKSYLGLNSESITDLRKQCHAESCKYLVVKNRVLKIVLRESGLEDIDKIEAVLKESTAVAFTKEDAVSVAKLLIKFGKTSNGLPKIKGGVIEGKWFDEKEVEYLSKLPSKEVLLATFMGVLKAPMNGFVSVLSGPIRGFVRALNAVAEKKGEENS